MRSGSLLEIGCKNADGFRKNIPTFLCILALPQGILYAILRIGKGVVSLAENFGVARMLEIQNELQEKYKGKWQPIGPDAARNKFMWAIGEMGEVIDIFKKRGEDKIMNDEETRTHFIEEMVDVYMYMADVLNCMGISAEDFADVYERKHAYNMKRDYVKANRKMFEEGAHDASFAAKTEEK